MSCICSAEGYSPECPKVFVQGGIQLHAIEREIKLTPRMFSRTLHSTSNDQGAVSESDDEIIPPLEHVPDQDCESSYDQALNQMNSMINSTQIASKQKFNAKIEKSDAFMYGNRVSLGKHEPLAINGRSLMEVSIGGFQIDMAETADQAKKILPLPPAKLPLIYVDQELNFYHHFFQGLERMLGRDTVLAIVKEAKHSTEVEEVLLPEIRRIISAGYEQSDSQLTLFTKSVLTTTFKIDPRFSKDNVEGGLCVAANLWGFQYIEQGIECLEPDLRMWLSMSYEHFRIKHFNAYKDSGMPAFVTEGVQTRYEKVDKSYREHRRNEWSNRALDIYDDRDVVYDLERARGKHSKDRSPPRKHEGKQYRTRRSTPSRGLKLLGM